MRNEIMNIAMTEGTILTRIGKIIKLLKKRTVSEEKIEIF